ncbi:MAG: DNRLRE domain-containing protein [Caldilineaceae bacterium]
MLVIAGFAFLFISTDSMVTQAQEEPLYIDSVRTIEIEDTGVINPTGLAFSTRSKAFHVLPGRAAGAAVPANVDVVRLGSYGDRRGSARIAEAIRDPINVAFDSARGRLLIYRSPANRLIAVPEDANGLLQANQRQRYNVDHFGVVNPQGMAVNSNNGDLFILDADAPRLLHIVPAADGTFATASITVVDLQGLGMQDVRGIAFHPVTEYLHIISRGEAKLYEITQSGELVTTRDLAAFDLKNPMGMVFAPTGDLTDDPANLDLYITDSALPGLRGNRRLQSSAYEPPTGKFVAYLPLVLEGIGGQALLEASLHAEIDAQIVRAAAAGDPTGAIVELTFDAAPAAAATTSAPTFVRAIEAFNWSPPSPDSSGIAYLPASNSYLVTDGEVNEMPIFQNANLFEMNAAGTLLSTMSSLSFSDEPSGADVNPHNNHLFTADDTGTRSVYEIAPGGDGKYGTNDDTVGQIRTGGFSSSDPEGVTFVDIGIGELYIADGVNREFYHLLPGPNGVFDGVAPNGDDIVSSFDTLSHGLDDPEGIVYNPYTGTIYGIGKPSGTLFEFTTNGALVQTLDVSAANARKPAGLALGPGSQNPNQLSLYIAARGVDNNSDPNENDGMVYEFSLGIAIGNSPTNTPTATNTPVPPTVTATNTPLPTNTPTPGPTLTPTNTSLPTNTSTATNTPLPTNTPTNTPTATNTPLPTATPTVTNTPANTPTPTNTPLVSTLTFNPVADSFVRSTVANSNFGTNTRLDVDSPSEETYLRFNITGVSGAVQSAILRFAVSNGSSNGPSLYGASNGWTETGITWNNKPAPTTGMMADVGSVTAGIPAEYNVTALITGNGEYNIVLLPDSTNGVTYDSRESSAPPQLIITFTTGPTATPTNTAPPTNTPTATNTPLPTNTPTATPIPTNTLTPTPGPSLTPTNTPLPPTATATATATNTPGGPPATTLATFAPVADSRVLAASPDTNSGTLTRLDIDSPGEQSYIRFALTGIAGTVQNATLRVYVTNSTSDGPGIYATDNSWSETGITWNNRPAPTSGAIDNLGSMPVNVWAEYNVTSAIAGDGDYNFVWLPDSSNGVRFESRESATPPELILTIAN